MKMSALLALAAFLHFGSPPERLRVNWIAARPLFHKMELLDLLEKDRYETTEDFNKRRARALACALPGKDVFLLADCEKTYDADSETLKLSTEPVLLREGEPFLAICVGSVAAAGDSYMGQNSFGVKVKIHKSNLTSFVLCPGNPDLEQFGYSANEVESQLSVTFPLTRKVASDSEQDFGLLFELLIDQPISFSSQCVDSHSPTIDAPNDTGFFEDRLCCTIKKVIIFNKRTKDVLSVVRGKIHANYLLGEIHTSYKNGGLTLKPPGAVKNGLLWEKHKKSAMLDGVVPDEEYTGSPRILAVGPSSRLMPGGCIGGLQFETEGAITPVSNWADIRRLLKGKASKQVRVIWKDSNSGSEYNFLIDIKY